MSTHRLGHECRADGRPSQNRSAARCSGDSAESPHGIARAAGRRSHPKLAPTSYEGRSAVAARYSADAVWRRWMEAPSNEGRKPGIPRFVVFSRRLGQSAVVPENSANDNSRSNESGAICPSDEGLSPLGNRPLRPSLSCSETHAHTPTHARALHTYIRGRGLPLAPRLLITGRGSLRPAPTKL